jgi:hypothetical protein
VHRIAAFAVVLLCAGAVPTDVGAAPVTLTIDTPDFLIPVNGQSGVLTVYADGTTSTSGFNALGTQSFALNGYATSAGTLTLNLVFTGAPLGPPFGDIASAILSMRVYDFDFVTDLVTQQVHLDEVAVLSGVNGVWLPLGERIDLDDYLPAGTPTDDRWVTLDPISLMPGPLSAADFIDPLMLSFTLTATISNYGSQKVTLLNTPESLIADVNLSLTQVPEPSMLPMLAASLAALAFRRREIRIQE